MKQRIPVIDLFAGPGGLGEGFASHSDDIEIALSVEADPHAQRTLRLRALHRLIGPSAFNSPDYLDMICNSVSSKTMDIPSELKDAWEESGEEAVRATIGDPSDDQMLRRKLDRLNLRSRDWILIGGPPCQAYSLAGRSRNKAVSGYLPQDDERHFLYREYLKIIREYEPAIFVMENVKGILTSSINGQKIFHQILTDLARPGQAVRKRKGSDLSYSIRSVSESAFAFEAGMEPAAFDSTAFTVHSENYGVPQQRHRVFLVGVRSDINCEIGELATSPRPPLDLALAGLPRIRSRLSKEPDNARNWRSAVLSEGRRLRKDASQAKLGSLAEELDSAISVISGESLDFGHGTLPGSAVWSSIPAEERERFSRLFSWLSGSNHARIFNHEARGHMRADLGRYLFAACFGRANGRSPKGTRDFSLPGLRPAHRNWESGHFEDRFRVQVAGEAATTVTSHISKDGHYYIHHDPTQCRSLTVREAARIQTFPDDYIFLGTRTQQYKQVGNAVPPFLARQIAQLLVRALRSV